MTDLFLTLGDVLAGKAPCPEPGEEVDGPYRRLFKALRLLGGDCRYAPGPGDLAALTRHVLRFEQERLGGNCPILPVPVGLPWPQSSDWERFGVEVLYATGGIAKVRATRWSPDWLVESVREPVDRAAYSGEERRHYGEPLPGDPFLDRFPAFSTYRSTSQREAVRAMLTAPAGSTLVANLPTGSGKSLAAYMPSLLEDRALTVVVVPTTTLALDQERAVFPYLGHASAYHSGQDAAGERNRGIRERMRAGTQRIVFSSPEAVVRSLAGPLYTAAAQGLLRLLAIDEAHIVDQWGDEFRPAFQELAGLRCDLLRRSVGEMPRTLLLTGTMTEPCLDTLEMLFGKPGPFGIVSAMQLRPEPSYWVAPSMDDGLRANRVLEAIEHLPRPLLLYVSLVDDANAWLARLGEKGFQRVAAVTGKTQSAERAEVMRAWQADEIDLVVATSAFGLGVDKTDVRAVIHACLPEHVDRYYQEVGRGGRDGRAAVSLLLPVPADLVTARRLNRRTLISTEEGNENKGYERWKAMYEGREELGDGRIRVPLTAVPEYAFGRFENSDANVAWNLRTLALLARAGVIELDAQPPPGRETFTDDSGTLDEERLNAERERHRLEKVVRVRNDDHLDLGQWRGGIEDVRSRSVRSAERGLELLRDALEGKRCFADLFAEAYTVPPREAPLRRPRVFVSMSCGGCPACRRAGREPYAGVMPRPAPPWPQACDRPAGELSRLLGAGHAAFLFDERLGVATGADRLRRERLVSLLIAGGFRTVVGSSERLGALRPLCTGDRVPPVFFAEEWESLHLPRTPALVIDPPDRSLGSILAAAGGGLRSALIVWLAADRRDPARPHRLLRQTIAGRSFRIEEFCTEVGL